jgi:hypothetical protein
MIAAKKTDLLPIEENPPILPSQCLFKLKTRSDLDFDAYAAALFDAGIILLELGFDNSDASIMKTIVENLGSIDTHDSQGTTIWDVKYDGNVVRDKRTRSLTTKEFPIHTDASFEEPPPKYVALYVVAEDSLGGGITQLIDGRHILQYLTREAISVLQTKAFKFKVPQEFIKNHDYIEASILDLEGNFRYRQEVLILDDCSPEELQAIHELELLLANKSLMKSIFLKTGTIIIFDNGRFLHGRTKVRDKNRHLKRLRFQAKQTRFGVDCETCVYRRESGFLG